MPRHSPYQPAIPFRNDACEQAHRDEIVRAYEQIIQSSHEHWQVMVRQWQQDDGQPTCQAWLMYAANYLMRTGSVRWAIDPMRPQWVNPQAQDVDASPLESLQFVLLTHDHKDHADEQLWHRLKHADIRWIVPSFMRDKFIAKTGIDDHRLITATPNQGVDLLDLHILPFEGLHWEYRTGQSTLGVPAMGYQVQWCDRTWLFPGDTRTYDPAPILHLRSPDVLFGHVWLGRTAASQEIPPLLGQMVSFIEALQPRDRIVLTHLYETSRTPEDCWSVHHAKMIARKLKEHRPRLEVIHPMIGEVIPL